MLHPRQAPPVAHRLIKRVARRRGPERLAIAPAKPLDRLFIQQSLGSREEGEALDTPAGPLIGGIKTPHRLDLIPEEIEPQGLFLASGKQVDNAATNGELAPVVHGIGPHITIGLQHLGEPRNRDPLLGRQLRDQLPHTKRRQRPLRQRIERRQDKLRPLGLTLQRIKSRQPRRSRAQRRTGPVIGKAVPGRNLDNLDLRRKIMRRVGHRPHELLVGRHEQRPRRRCSRNVREHPRLKPRRNAGEGHGRGGFEDLQKVGHLILSSPPASGRG